MSDNARQFYFCLDGQNVQGPVDQSTLERLIYQETIPSTGMILKEGEDTWFSIAEYSQEESTPSSEVLAAPTNAFPNVENSSSAQSVTFKAATCPSCGGPLQVPTHMQRVKCMYCGSDVIVQKASAASGEPGVEQYLRLARVARQQGSNPILRQKGSYAEAEKNYLLALEHDLSCKEAWSGRMENPGLFDDNGMSFRARLDVYRDFLKRNNLDTTLHQSMNKFLLEAFFRELSIEIRDDGYGVFGPFGSDTFKKLKSFRDMPRMHTQFYRLAVGGRERP